jgi:tetratricopeptide (TPR) repeat protein
MKLAAVVLAAAAFALPAATAPDPTNLGVGYICAAEQAPRAARPEAAVMLTGVGNGVAKADTADPRAQAWFQEGLNLYHAFNHQEARDAFARAVAIDTKCALCEWGVALGLGPTLNYGVTAEQRTLALSHARRAAELAAASDTRTKALIEAMVVRYGEASDRNVAFGKAMEALAARYPTDDVIANVAAEALMIPGRGSNKEATARAEALIKGVLARHPDDTAAIHYYIHASEFLGHPAEALPYADKLAGLAPNAGHLVHMAAHTLIHVGQYERVALVNAQALKADATLEASKPPQATAGAPQGAAMYYLHNYVFGLEGALMAGDGPLALKYASHADVAFPDSFNGGILVPTGLASGEGAAQRRATAEARALVAEARFAPDRVLAMQERAGDPELVKTYLHYARGEAYAAKGDPSGVRREAAAVLGQKVTGTTLGGGGERQASGLNAIAADVLEGRAALIEHDPAKAQAAFARAAQRQETAYPFAESFDPPPWWYPVRRSLAYADLAAGKPADAAREAKASLVDWPDDALALRVLAEAEAKLGDAKAAAAHQAQARAGWKGDLQKVPMVLT